MVHDKNIFLSLSFILAHLAGLLAMSQKYSELAENWLLGGNWLV